MNIEESLIDLSLEWFKGLLKIDTSNPPGNEKPAIEFISSILNEHGIEFTTVAKDPARPNLIATIAGDSDEDGILLSSHVDVVPVEDDKTWSYPPFEAREAAGLIFGRGTLDMKYKTAFDLAVMIAASKGKKPGRTLQMACLADEECGGDYGVEFLTTEHLDLIHADYVFNEVGGFTMPLGDKIFLPIQAGEEHICQIRLHAQGSSMHASMPQPNSSIVMLSRAIAAFEDSFLGFQLCDVSQALIRKVAASVSEPVSSLFGSLESAEHVEAGLAQIPDPVVRSQLKAMLCHSICPTRIGGGFKTNVVPEASWVDLDCRVVPSVSTDDFLVLVETFLAKMFPEFGSAFTIEVIRQEDGYQISPDEEMFKRVCALLEKTLAKECDRPIAAPLLLPAGSDSSAYARAGLTPIGLAPLIFPPDFPGFALTHASDERIPVSAFRKGLAAYGDVVSQIIGA